MEQTQTTLVATLGGKPQKVSFLLDLLIQNNNRIDQVIIIYLSKYKRAGMAFDRLKKEFEGGQYQGKPCKLVGVPIKTSKSDLVDIRNAQEVEIVRQNVHWVLSDLKQQGQQVHLGLCGGRKLIYLVALATAMQYLTPADCIWHIYDPEGWPEQEKTGLHADPKSGISLVPVPFVPWVSYIPGLSSLLKRSQQDIAEDSWGWLKPEDRNRCERVWDQLSPGQKPVLQAFANGLSRKDVAKKLNIAAATVDTHRKEILDQCVIAWEGQAENEPDTLFLLKYFGPYLKRRGLLF